MGLKLALIAESSEINKHIEAIKKIKERIFISSIYSLDKNKISLDIKTYNNENDFFEQEKCDAVFISAKIENQKELIFKSLNNNWNIILEKPIFDKISDFDQIIDKSRQRNKVVFYSSYYGNQPHLKAIEELISENIIGNIKFCQISILKDFIPYPFDNFDQNLWYAFEILNIIIKKNPINLKADIEINIENSAKTHNISIKYLDSFANIYTKNDNFKEKEFISIYGEKGNIFFEDSILKIERQDIETQTIKFKQSLLKDSLIWQKTYDDFLNAINNKEFYEKNLKLSALKFRLINATIKSKNSYKIIPV